ncbi:MAG: nitroreductase family protein [Chloroflexi bacterium]|nr:nitroreductase family protein [Chloroflexota bacterium]
MAEPGIFETIYAQRAIRRFRPEPVPREVIERIVEAATHAPSGGNRQPWAFVVVTDAEKKRRIAEWYHEGWVAMYASDPSRPRNAVYRSAEHLAEHMAETPVLVFPCIAAGGGRRPPFQSGSSIYPAAQNLMLAAAALGVGTVITTFHLRREAEVKALLGIPDDYATASMIAMGYPAEGERFGGARRDPVSEVTHYESWGGV